MRRFSFTSSDTIQVASRSPHLVEEEKRTEIKKKKRLGKRILIVCCE
jgi:hypothetical protein